MFRGSLNFLNHTLGQQYDKNRMWQGSPSPKEGKCREKVRRLVRVKYEYEIYLGRGASFRFIYWELIAEEFPPYYAFLPTQIDDWIRLHAGR